MDSTCIKVMTCRTSLRLQVLPQVFPPLDWPIHTAMILLLLRSIILVHLFALVCPC